MKLLEILEIIQGVKCEETTENEEWNDACSQIAKTIKAKYKEEHCEGCNSAPTHCVGALKCRKLKI